MIDKILTWLQGKKASIATILGAILVFVLNRHYIAGDTAQMIAVILMALGIGSNVATSQMVAKDACGCNK